MKSILAQYLPMKLSELKYYQINLSIQTPCQLNITLIKHYKNKFANNVIAKGKHASTLVVSNRTVSKFTRYRNTILTLAN